jgi:thioredoxin reductase (NADPH)
MTELFPAKLNLSPEGYLITDEYLRTNIPGVYGAGDVRKTVLRQLVTAVADGAVAAVSALKYIEEQD